MKAKINLSGGQWRFRFDLDDVGDSRGWFLKEQPKSGWRRVRVPGAWDSYGPEFEGYEGVAWYAVDIPAKQIDVKQWQRISFPRVFDSATVWINGREVIRHECGYLPFEVNLTPHVQAKQDVHVVVKVVAKVDPHKLPGGRVVEWPQFGGIHEAPELITTGKVYIDPIRISAQPDGAGAKVRCSIGVVNQSEKRATGRLKVTIKKGSLVLPSWVDYSCEARSRTEIRCDVAIKRAQCWSPGSPELYQADVEIEGEQGSRTSVSFGVRSIETRGNQILLNGLPIVLKGFCRYDFMPGHVWTLTKARIRQDLLKLKKMGGNFVRVHFPQSRDFHEVMDELGLMLLEEVPLNWWRVSFCGPWSEEFQNLNVIGKAEVALGEMINLYGNHPCVIGWSMANECCTDDELGITAMRRLLAKSKQLDPSRLAVFSVSGNVRGHLACEQADVVCPNIYYGLFSGEVAQDIGEIDVKVYQASKNGLLDMTRQYPDKPILVTESGNHGIRGIRDGVRGAEDFQAAYLVAVWRAVAEVDGVCGISYWAWSDYPHRRGFLGPWPTDYAPYGVVTYDRKLKQGYQALKKLWIR